jgi:hypothetical protein
MTASVERRLEALEALSQPRIVRCILAEEGESTEDAKRRHGIEADAPGLTIIRTIFRPGKAQS